jgi:hypothetical protein
MLGKYPTTEIHLQYFFFLNINAKDGAVARNKTSLHEKRSSTKTEAFLGREFKEQCWTRWLAYTCVNLDMSLFVLFFPTLSTTSLDTRFFFLLWEILKEDQLCRQRLTTESSSLAWAPL